MCVYKINKINLRLISNKIRPQFLNQPNLNLRTNKANKCESWAIPLAFHVRSTRTSYYCNWTDITILDIYFLNNWLQVKYYKNINFEIH